jgi:hypothetical protein
LSGLQRLHYIDPVEAFNEIIFQTTNSIQLSNVLYTIEEVSIGLVATVLSIALLFRVVVPENTRKNIENKWYWKLFFRRLMIGERRVWQILIGYFITLLILTPTAADATRQYLGGEKIETYYIYLTTIPALTVVIIATRILSKLRLKLIDTNIGAFIMAVYVAEFIFSVSFGKTPLDQFINLISSVDSAARAAFIIYEVTAVGAIAATIIDWFIITKVMGKEL